jgi:hypothetical protein
MRSTQLAATCTPIRTCRIEVARCRCRAPCKAGVSPNRIAAANPMATAKKTTRQSGAGSSQSGAPVIAIRVRNTT